MCVCVGGGGGGGVNGYKLSGYRQNVLCVAFCQEAAIPGATAAILNVFTDCNS